MQLTTPVTTAFPEGVDHRMMSFMIEELEKRNKERECQRDAFIASQTELIMKLQGQIEEMNKDRMRQGAQPALETAYTPIGPSPKRLGRSDAIPRKRPLESRS